MERCRGGEGCGPCLLLHCPKVQPEVLAVEVSWVLPLQVKDCLDASQLQKLVIRHGVAVVDHVKHSLHVGGHVSIALLQLPAPGPY